ncbi:acyl-CoA dehydrogenase family protein [Brevibacterium sp. R8603A2]|uniref:acyl-CoA dehydrogenase family protein n=1 Tax=Brevibacterium sp. R8603A2 TaxID=2929779 RepID=UPI001FF88C5C|nr:acyl-CoA dehydrogenase family protein [Brevibacterium sp. R8603A2]MCK1802444.1 acyl-CoA dehydrogenase family protein [Brevibacterium sp. R8603A2]
MNRTKTPLTIDPSVLGDLLDGRWASERRRGRALVEHPDTVPPITGDLDEMREATLRGVRALAESGSTLRSLPTELGGENDHAGYVAAFEESVTASPSLQIKAGVQYGLFGGAIQHLGNAEQHAQWLLPAQRGELLGCFAMTEIGHGSDVASLGTTAVYDPAAEEFVITTPFRAATKEYIGNAAAHGRAAVVFAQLITAGVDHGVHAFFVPIRTEDGEPMPGVSIEDDGRKGGLLGVDNGRLAFADVRVPRTHLLDRYGAVAPDGTYSSPIDSPGRRFFTMLGTLVQGRVSLDGAAVVAAKLGLDIAVRYGLERRQFTGADDTEEVVLMDYQQHQRRLMPLLAETYANAIAHEVLLASFQRVFSGEDDSDEARQLLETQAAGFKATSTWDALDILQECREACGGAGFMTENRLTGLRADLDVYVTFEGDNTVLLQLVGKRLLGDYAAEFKNIDVGGVARFIGTQAAEHSLYRSGLANVGRTIGEVLTPGLTERRIRSGRLQELLLSARVDTMVAELASNLRPASKLPKEEAAALLNENQHELIEAAKAYVELLKWQALNTAMHTFDDDPRRADEAKALRRIRDLYGLTLIERSIGWHIMYGRLSMNRARQVGPAINRLCAKLAGNAADLVAAFGYGPEHRRATIAEGVEARRQTEAREHYRRARAQADHPVDEKVLHRERTRKG